MKRRFNYRFILKTLGFLLIIEALFMLLTAFVAFYYKEIAGDSFLLASGITLASGIVFRLIGIETEEHFIGKREGFLLVTLTWIVLSAFGMIPYLHSGVISNITDAFFETISGFTTTGATILTDVSSVPNGFLFWRNITQWIGGIGIVVFALALLPMIGGNASFLYDAETTGIAHERFQPRVTQVAKRIWFIYIGLTLFFFLLLWAGPMAGFDAVCHAMTALACGGYSTQSDSIGFWDSAYIEYVMIFAMFVGGMNFTLLYFFFKGKPKRLLIDEEFKWYIAICVIVTIIIAGSLLINGNIAEIEKSFRISLFMVVSMVTSSGFVIPGFYDQGAFYMFISAILCLFCACAGSTSGGMKIVRLIVLSKNAMNQFKLQVHPNAILPVRINGNVVPIDMVTKVLAFIFLYLATLLVGVLVLSFSGMGFEESIGTSIACVSNIGTGLGEHIEDGHFADIPTFSKWFCGLLMLTGRLELFTVLSLFMPSFWKK